MDELIYNLLLKSRGGLVLFGVLRYRLTGIEVDQVRDASVFSTPALRQSHAGQRTQQQLDNIFALVLRAQGSITIPALTGSRAVPVEDVAFFIQMGPPIVTRLFSADSSVLLCFNQINNQQIGGGLLWGPTNTSFGLLGRRQMLPAAA
ncbi:hypothetical protein ASF61_15550 [Duganella sp. Leaf126]|uniref:hypothetical protein n=1 Tax=Duganella sp. Leaf126 TaxID=1736266 RepID=UPI000700DC50|nr:hypothetical protein [Duganella sp. Leaf126]KQQ32443.1 hypothetical protein ASF61_15550 [Duganella sp. Leaf126]